MNCAFLCLLFFVGAKYAGSYSHDATDLTIQPTLHTTERAATLVATEASVLTITSAPIEVASTTVAKEQVIGMETTEPAIQVRRIAPPDSITYKKVKEDTINGLAYIIFEALDTATNEPLTVLQWATLMATSPRATVLAQDLTQIITNLPFKGVFLETPGVTSQNAVTKPMKLCLLDGITVASFAEPQASPSAFSQHLNCAGDPNACRFSNLGGDATLVSPKRKDPNADNKVYSHLMAFLRSGPPDQVAAVWKKVAETYQSILENKDSSQPVWLDTEGSGVPWLHFRFDSRPKYYHYTPFADEK